MIMVTSFILRGFVLPTFIRFSVDKEKIGRKLIRTRRRISLVQASWASSLIYHDQEKLADSNKKLFSLVVLCIFSTLKYGW